ncbi:MAG TPA: GNAT family N-acetyltransferase [Candidatus Thermoplasmatota archaeon]|nr:GNAT family N-acetyltransferase [Candidatus Thermoplasmatota archaeon]
MDPLPTPTLRGRRVVLEPLAPEHAPGLAEAVEPGDDVWRWTNTAPRGEAEMRAWIRDRLTPRHGCRNLAFAQRDPASGRLMGSTSLFDVDRAAESAEIGHTWLAAPWRRTGANTEAKLLLLAHAFDALGLKRVQLVTDERNDRSRRAIERIGAKPEGILRNWRRNVEGGLRNSAVYSVIVQEWPETRAALEKRLR